MKKILVSLVLIISLASKSLAFVPIIIPAWVYGTAAAITVAGAASGLYYGMKGSGSTTISPLGVVSRSSAAVYATLIAGVMTVKTDDIKAVMPVTKVSEIGNKVDTQGNPLYPKVKSALEAAYNYTNSPPSVLPLATTSPVGSSVTVNDVPYTITSSLFYSHSTNMPYAGMTVGVPHLAGGYVWLASQSSGDFKDTYRFTVTAYVAPPATTNPATPLSIAMNLALSTSLPAPVQSYYTDEIDKMFQDPSYVPAFTDDTTGLPYSPPPVVASPSAINSYNAKQELSTALAQSKTIADSAADQAGIIAMTAQTALDVANNARWNLPSNATSDQIAAADKNVSDAAATLYSAQNAKAAAEAVAAKTDVDIARVNAETLAGDAEAVPDVAANVPARPARKAIDFEPFKALVGVMSVTYPFNLPSSVNSYFEALSVSGSTAPVFDLPLPLGNVIHCDLAIFDPLATVIRYIVGIVITCGMLFYVIHFFRGIS